MQGTLVTLGSASCRTYLISRLSDERVRKPRVQASIAHNDPVGPRDTALFVFRVWGLRLNVYVKVFGCVEFGLYRAGFLEASGFELDIFPGYLAAEFGLSTYDMRNRSPFATPGSLPQDPTTYCFEGGVSEN